MDFSYDDGIQQWINRDSCQSNNGSCAFFFPDIPYARYCFQVTAKNALSNSTTECVPMEMLEIGTFWYNSLNKDEIHNA